MDIHATQEHKRIEAAIPDNCWILGYNSIMLTGSIPHERGHSPDTPGISPPTPPCFARAQGQVTVKGQVSSISVASM